MMEIALYFLLILLGYTIGRWHGNMYLISYKSWYTAKLIEINDEVDGLVQRVEALDKRAK
jgi:hypothetical protein